MAAAAGSALASLGASYDSEVRQALSRITDEPVDLIAGSRIYSWHAPAITVIFGYSLLGWVFAIVIDSPEGEPQEGHLLWESRLRGDLRLSTGRLVCGRSVQWLEHQFDGPYRHQFTRLIDHPAVEGAVIKRQLLAELRAR